MPKADPKTPERRERFQDYCKSKGWGPDASGRWPITAISEAIGKPRNKVSDLVRGNGSFGKQIREEIEDHLGLARGYFDGVVTSDDFAPVPVVNVKVSAGHGAVVYDEGKKSALSFKWSFLRDVGVSPKSAVVVTVRGHSMEPTIRDGAVLLVSTSAKNPIDREIYAIRVDGELYVKRLIRTAAGWFAASDNPDRTAYPDIPLADVEAESEIIGRALWMGVRL